MAKKQNTNHDCRHWGLDFSQIQFTLKTRLRRKWNKFKSDLSVFTFFLLYFLFSHAITMKCISMLPIGAHCVIVKYEATSVFFVWEKSKSKFRHLI